MMQVTTADVCEDGERCACYDYWVRATGTWSVLLLLLLAVTALHVSHAATGRRLWALRLCVPASQQTTDADRVKGRDGKRTCEEWPRAAWQAGAARGATAAPNCRHPGRT